MIRKRSATRWVKQKHLVKPMGSRSAIRWVKQKRSAIYWVKQKHLEILKEKVISNAMEKPNAMGKPMEMHF
jgi:hypothetical protein